MGHRAAFRGADPSRKLPYRGAPSAALVASDYTLAAATLVFLLTYVLISLRTVRRFPIERPAVAMLGGALMLVLGVLTPTEALLAINLDVIVLLVGMMLLVSGLEICGLFDLVSSRIAVRAKNQAAFLAWLMVATAALSALVPKRPRGSPDAHFLGRARPAPADRPGGDARRDGRRRGRVLRLPDPRMAAPGGARGRIVRAVLLAVLREDDREDSDREGGLEHHPLLRRSVHRPRRGTRVRTLRCDPGRLHCLRRRSVRRPRLAGRSLGAALEPDQQRARGVALGRIAAWLDPTLACTGRKLDAGGGRDDPRGPVQRHRRASRIPRRSQGGDEGLREGGGACHRRDARPVDGPGRGAGTRGTAPLCLVRVVACRWARRPISPRSGFGWWSDSSPPGTSRIRGCEMRSSRCRGRRSSGPRMRTLPMTTSRSRLGEARRFRHLR